MALDPDLARQFNEAFGRHLAEHAKEHTALAAEAKKDGGAVAEMAFNLPKGFCSAWPMIKTAIIGLVGWFGWAFSGSQFIIPLINAFEEVFLPKICPIVVPPPAE